MDKRKDWLKTDGIITTLIDWYMAFFSFVWRIQALTFISKATLILARKFTANLSRVENGEDVSESFM